MTSAIGCSLWSSVYECQRVECRFHISGDDCVWYVCDVLYAVKYVHVSCFDMLGCAVSRSDIYVCNNNVFTELLICTLTIFKYLCVLMVEGIFVVVNVMLFLNKCNEPTPCLVQPIGSKAIIFAFITLQ